MHDTFVIVSADAGMNGIQMPPGITPPAGLGRASALMMNTSSVQNDFSAGSRGRGLSISQQGKLFKII